MASLEHVAIGMAAARIYPSQPLTGRAWLKAAADALGAASARRSRARRRPESSGNRPRSATCTAAARVVVTIEFGGLLRDRPVSVIVKQW
jgi:hypothetical protein